jgi:hypothetical protein
MEERGQAETFQSADVCGLAIHCLAERLEALPLRPEICPDPRQPRAELVAPPQALPRLGQIAI